MNIKEIEKVVGKIQSNLFRNSNSYSIGMLKSCFAHSRQAQTVCVRFLTFYMGVFCLTSEFFAQVEEKNDHSLFACDGFSHSVLERTGYVIE